MSSKAACFAGLAMVLGTTAWGEGLFVSFDPPRKIEILKASGADGKFVAATVGRASGEAFHDVLFVTLGKGAPSVARSNQSTPFAAVALGRPATVRSIVFTWKEGIATAHLATADANLRVTFEKDGDKGVVEEIEAKEVPARDGFPELRVTKGAGPKFIGPKAGGK